MLAGKAEQPTIYYRNIQYSKLAHEWHCFTCHFHWSSCPPATGEGTFRAFKNFCILLRMGKHKSQSTDLGPLPGESGLPTKLITCSKYPHSSKNYVYFLQKAGISLNVRSILVSLKCKWQGSKIKVFYSLIFFISELLYLFFSTKVGLQEYSQKTFNGE